jgi:hypothetical protein
LPKKEGKVFYLPTSTQLKSHPYQTKKKKKEENNLIIDKTKEQIG